MKRQVSQVILTFVFLVSLVGLHAKTNTVVIPKEAEEMFGDIYGDPIFFSSNVQQVYAASEFSNTTSDVLTITEVAFRSEETERPLDGSRERLSLLMNIFAGSMDEVVQRKSGLMAPIIDVFRGTNIHCTGATGRVDAFDVRFPLSPPFVYDRSQGHLILTFSGSGGYSGQVSDLDAHGIRDHSGNFSFQRGAYISPQRLGAPDVSPIILVTRFSYIITLASIEAFYKNEDNVRIEFRVTNSPGPIQVEGAIRVDGPYAPIDNLEIATVGSNKFQATIPLSTSNHFFRITLR